jgi:Mg2+ and Co2+ transporter CorA
VEPQPFNIKLLGLNKLQAKDRKKVVKFQEQVSELRRAITSASGVLNELSKRHDLIKVALNDAPKADYQLKKDINAIEKNIKDIERRLYGDRSLSKREFEQAPSCYSRIGSIVYGLWRSTSAPTNTQKEQYEIAAEEFGPILDDIKQLKKDIEAVEQALEKAGAPWTPGRLPDWK